MFQQQKKLLCLFPVIIFIGIITINFHFTKLTIGINLEETVEIQNESYVCQESFLGKRNLLDFHTEFQPKIIRRHPNLPLFLASGEKLPNSMPDITSIRWTGIVYQESWKESPKFLLYSAHFDARLPFLLIRIIALYDGEAEPASSNLFCQMWFEKDDNPVMVPVYEIEKIYRRSKPELMSYGIFCKVPLSLNSSDVPIAVAIVKTECQKPYNIMKIVGSPWKKTDQPRTQNQRWNITIGICGKALFYYNDDFSLRLIEWIEIMKLLGVTKIFLYLTTCHPNVQKVMEFYEEQGIVSLVSFYYPPPYVQEGTFFRFWTKTKRGEYFAAQSIYLNDCILRNKDDYDYLGVFDSDEIPILRKHKTLQDFIKSLIRNNDKEFGSIFLRWKHFYADLKPDPSTSNLTNNFYILQHNQRTKLTAKEAKTIEQNGKSIYDTNKALWISCHSSLRFLDHDLTTVKYVARSLAYTAHFGVRNCRPEYCNKEDLEEEIVLFNFRKIGNTVNRVTKILEIE